MLIQNIIKKPYIDGNFITIEYKTSLFRIHIFFNLNKLIKMIKIKTYVCSNLNEIFLSFEN